MTVDEKEILLDGVNAEGAKAYWLGFPESVCPYGLTRLMERNGWLAGYRDAERGMAA